MHFLQFFQASNRAKHMLVSLAVGGGFFARASICGLFLRPEDIPLSSTNPPIMSIAFAPFHATGLSLNAPRAGYKKFRRGHFDTHEHTTWIMKNCRHSRTYIPRLDEVFSSVVTTQHRELGGFPLSSLSMQLHHAGSVVSAPKTL